MSTKKRYTKKDTNNDTMTVAVLVYHFVPLYKPLYHVQNLRLAANSLASSLPMRVFLRLFNIVYSFCLQTYIFFPEIWAV